MLRGKKILTGVTGSIAAYKSAFLVRLLVKEKADVTVVMTPSAPGFITPLTLATLSGKPVLTDFTSPENASWTNHVSNALWADLILIAPATANTIAKMASGICDNFLLACYLSSRCPVIIAPAMDLDMYAHPATQKNLEILKAHGCFVIDPGNGELASGLSGEGRMAEPEEIINYLKNFLNKKQSLAGKKALVSAGPTYEAIDPVRFIGNHSSGKMGFALAESLARRGAEVTVVAGPVDIRLNNPAIKRIDVTSAEQMYNACMKHFPASDIAIMAAAVSDFRPEKVEKKKIKSGRKELIVELIETTDILESMGKVKKGDQLLAGFALETDNEIENAKGKIKNKNLDFIVLNSLNDSGAGFQHDTNKITIIDRMGEIRNFNLKSKKEVAEDIVLKVEEFFLQAEKI